MSIEATPVTMELTWGTAGRVSRDESGKLQVPRTDAAPGIYRLTLRTPEATRLYLGETVDLRRAFQHFRTPGPRQPTNLRLQGEMLACLGSGGTVTAEICTRALLLVEGADMEADLFNERMRKFVKSAAVAAAREDEAPSLPDRWERAESASREQGMRPGFRAGLEESQQRASVETEPGMAAHDGDDMDETPGDAESVLDGAGSDEGVEGSDG
jgi:hypothetical protein